MNWTEIKVSVPLEFTDTAAAIANMTVPYGIYIEDYSDLEEKAEEIAHIDLIDEELINKLESLAGRKQAQQLKRQVFVSNRIKTMNESIYYSVDYIHGAMIDDKRISFKYFDWNEKKEKVLRHGGRKYTVSPWALMWDDENYYLIAYDSRSGQKSITELTE